MFARIVELTGDPDQRDKTNEMDGFIEPFTKELPIEYAVVLKWLMQLEMAGSVG